MLHECGTEVRSGAQFCPGCGSPVPTDAPPPAIAPLPGEPCAQCGAVLKTGARFCNSCGTPTAPPVAEATMPGDSPLAWHDDSAATASDPPPPTTPPAPDPPARDEELPRPTGILVIVPAPTAGPGDEAAPPHEPRRRRGVIAVVVAGVAVVAAVAAGTYLLTSSSGSDTSSAAHTRKSVARGDTVATAPVTLPSRTTVPTAPTAPTTISPRVGVQRYAITDPVILRSGTSTASPQIGMIPAGTVVVVQCATNGEVVDGPYGPDVHWDRVMYGGVLGYVTDEYVNTQDDVNNPALIPPC
jgi:Double zinc ribbon